MPENQETTIQSIDLIAPALVLKSDRVQYEQFKAAQPVKGLLGERCKPTNSKERSINQVT